MGTNAETGRSDQRRQPLESIQSLRQVKVTWSSNDCPDICLIKTLKRKNSDEDKRKEKIEIFGLHASLQRTLELDRRCGEKHFEGWQGEKGRSRTKLKSDTQHGHSRDVFSDDGDDLSTKRSMLPMISTISHWIRLSCAVQFSFLTEEHSSLRQCDEIDNERQEHSLSSGHWSRWRCFTFWRKCRLSVERSSGDWNSSISNRKRTERMTSSLNVCWTTRVRSLPANTWKPRWATVYVHGLTVISHCQRGCCSFPCFSSTFKLDWSIQQTLTLRHESLSIDRVLMSWHETRFETNLSSFPNPCPKILCCFTVISSSSMRAMTRTQTWKASLRSDDRRGWRTFRYFSNKVSRLILTQSKIDREKSGERWQRAEWKHQKAWSTTQSKSPALELNVLVAIGEFLERKNKNVASKPIVQFVWISSENVPYHAITASATNPPGCSQRIDLVEIRMYDLIYFQIGQPFSFSTPTTRSPTPLTLFSFATPATANNNPLTS